MSKLLCIFVLIILSQLAENRYEVTAQSYPLNVQQKRSDSQIGGISVEHPLQATIYAYRRGKMKLMIPFEINVVPMGNSGLEPELPAPSAYPISGQIRPQQNTNPLPYNANSYRPTYSGGSYQFGPSYSAPSSSYRPYPPAYASHNGYSQQSSYRYPYYAQPSQRIDLSQAKPWPHFNLIQQVAAKNTTNAIATNNWPGSSTTSNMNTLGYNATQSPNATAPNATTTTITTTAMQTTTTAITTSTTPQTTLQTSTTSSPSPSPSPFPLLFTTNASPILPQFNKLDTIPLNEIPPMTQNFADVGYMQPNYAPNFEPAPILPDGMNINGEYVDQAAIQQI